MQTEVSLLHTRLLLFFFFFMLSPFCGAIFNSKQTSSKEMSLCLFQETSRRQEREREPSRRENRGKRKQEQRQKLREIKEEAITYLCESEHMNMEESNGFIVPHSKCFPNYQAVANTINMIVFIGIRAPNILYHCIFIRIAFISFFCLSVRI